MQLLLYDGSFEGWLTAVFEVYEYKITNPQIKRVVGTNGSLFGNVHVVSTNQEKAKRVLMKMEQKISKMALSQFYKSFLSELPGITNSKISY